MDIQEIADKAKQAACVIRELASLVESNMKDAPDGPDATYYLRDLAKELDGWTVDNINKARGGQYE